MANKLKVSLKRKCPGCGEEKEYWYRYTYNRAVQSNAKCGVCASWNKGKIGVYSEETLKKNSESHKGKTPWNKGKIGISSETHKKMSLAKIGKKVNPNIVKKRNLTRQKSGWFTEKAKANISKSKIGHEVSQEVRDKIGKTVREYRFKEIKEKFGVKFPNYNPKGCKIIDEYNKKYGYSFQHAENGGEICIDGYWPDGLDESRKTIIEIDESHHFNSDGTYSESDIKRQNYLEKLGYKVIRIKV